jgi:carboxylesterase type B
MVFVHGGAFVTGEFISKLKTNYILNLNSTFITNYIVLLWHKFSGSSNGYRPSYFMDEDVILVTINYRYNSNSDNISLK